MISPSLTVPQVTVLETLQVHVDDEVLASARRHQDSAGGASFTSALREKAAAPARLNPLQALSAPLESSKVRLLAVQNQSFFFKIHSSYRWY